MKILQIDHIAINVLDLEQSLQFYKNVLGFKQMNTVDCGEFTITYFQLLGTARLELFDYHGKNARMPRGESVVGLRHLAFQVQDVADLEKELRDKGVTILLSTCDLPDLGARVMLFNDPNGVTIEFTENLGK